jgi:hypothetical protein
MTKDELQTLIDAKIPKRLGAELREDENGDLFVRVQPVIEMRVPGLPDEDMVLQGIEGLLNAIIGECVVTAHGMRENAVNHTIQMPQIYRGRR